MESGVGGKSQLAPKVGGSADLHEWRPREFGAICEPALTDSAPFVENGAQGSGVEPI